MSTLIRKLKDRVGNIVYPVVNSQCFSDSFLDISHGGTGATNAEDVRQNLGISGAETKKPLWQNSSPSSTFPAQTISLDLRGYDFVEIYIDALTLWGEAYTNVNRIPVGKNGQLTVSIQQNMFRDVSVTESGISFGVGYRVLTYGASGTQANEACAPLLIYGIKVVE